MAWIERHWYRDSWVSWLLQPVALVYCAAASAKRFFYRTGLFRAQTFPVPVIVIGNVTVGGTGKTPLVLWTSRFLAQRGWRPGIVSRGYGGKARTWPQLVGASSDPSLVGDEPVLLGRRAGVPVVADPDRPRGVRELLAQGCDIIVADDGLQHYRLHRDVEIAVLDGERRMGNRRCLPAGPLREPASRWDSVDARVVNGAPVSDAWSMKLVPVGFYRLGNSGESLPADGFRGRRVHAVAGIGNPDRFFSTLRAQGIEVIEHAFRDHHAFAESDLDFGDNLDVVMTEKDAVKCDKWASPNRWYLAVEAEMDPRFGDWLQQRLRRR